MKFEGIYCFSTARVRFAVYPEGPEGRRRMLASVAVDVLRDRFGARELDRGALEVCRANFSLLEEAVMARFQKDPVQPVDLQLHELASAKYDQHARYAVLQSLTIQTLLQAEQPDTDNSVR